jgi:hypothetical protein
MNVTEITTPNTPSTETEQKQGGEGEIDEATYTAFLSELDNIATLPLQSAPQAHTVRDHDAILYPRQGTMPG